MAVFFRFSNDRQAPGSFQVPVKPPAHKPGDPRQIQVCFNADWLPYIIGSLFQLTMNTTWQVDTSAQLEAVLEEANNLILLFQLAKDCPQLFPGSQGVSEDFMLRQNPDNPCELQSSVDGVTWCTWADLSKCLANPPQPGDGSTQPKPGGGCTTYHGTFEGSNTWILPTVVATGDTIHVTGARGATNDGGEVNWYCPDGEQFFAGACVGFTTTESADPLPLVFHMRMIAKIGSTFYDVLGPTFTVPIGHLNDQVIFQVNDDDLDFNSGSIQFDVEVCNNQLLSWSHTFDFALSPSSWNVVASECGQWVPGTGFQSTHDATLCVNDDAVSIEITLPAATYTGWSVDVNSATAINTFFNLITGASTDNPTVVAGLHTYPSTHVPASGDHLEVAVGQRPFTATGQFIVASVTITGSGADPF